MNENQKIIELKRKINNDDFRLKEAEIREQNRRNKLNAPKKKKRKINLINLVFIVFLLYFAYTAFNQRQMIKALDVQIAEKNAVKSEVKKKADELKQDVDKINNDEEAMLDLVEKIARNEYKMVKPNEIIYIDKSKNDNKFIKGIGFENETDEEQKSSDESDPNSENKENKDNKDETEKQEGQ